ncbi:MAG: 16S rRNA (uracil(1498)-N(3))-methyltransferase [Myxococcales bacterium]|nr:16S rRNA (uracil(1498)-N(3))-methyltransferase [Myxococcales bacterium]
MKQLWLDADLTASRLRPDPAQWRRLRKVLRFKDGQRVMVADGNGARRTYELSGDTLLANAPLHHAPQHARRIHVGVGVLKGERQSWLLQKLVEVGATDIAPLGLTHCVVKLAADRAEKRKLRWDAIAIEAFEQCGRSQLPTISGVQRLASWLGSLPEGTRVAWCDERDRAVALTKWVADNQTNDLALVIGPEGGLSDEERTLLQRAGAAPVHLGDAVLRAETAAIVATWTAAHTA